MVFATLVFSNLFLAMANRSFVAPFHRTIFYKNRALPIILGISAAMLMAILYVPFLQHLFKMEAISAVDLGWCLLAGLASVVWFEIYKAIRHKW